MKSLLISKTYFPPQVGGISEFMASVSLTLRRDEICCLTGVRDQKLAPKSSERLSQVKIYRRPSAFAGSTAIHATGWAAAIGEIMLRERPRVVQLATMEEAYLGLWLKRWLKLPYLIYAHGNEILGVKQTDWPIPKQALLKADKVVAVSRFTAELLRELGVQEERIELMHPGCDVEYFRPLDASAEMRRTLLGNRVDSPVILTVGNLVARKGQDMVIKSLPLLRARIPNCVYLIVGGGPYREELEKLAASLGVQNNVVFAGQLPDAALPEVYALGDVFVMPSRAQLDKADVEGFGMVYLEANACGKPAIGGRSGGVPDAIVDGVTGLLVTPDDPNDIARALELLLGNRDLARRMGEAGRARAVSDFTWIGFAERLRTVLNGIV